jgi:cyanate permease
MTVGGILGPAFAGWVFDVTGSYGIAWIVLAALTAVAGATVLLVRRPRPAAVPDSA